MDKTAQRHMNAITAGKVEKSNITGIRKILAHVDSIGRGYSGNRCNATLADADAIMVAIYHNHPTVIGDLHNSGLAVLRNPRYAKRWGGKQSAIIASPHLKFQIVDFIDINRGHFVPVYEAVSPFGSFRFYNIPWQSGGNGPQVTE